MKVHIVYKLKDGPYGGVNQFLKAIRAYFKEKNLYSENANEADVYLFNSCNEIEKVIELKKKYPNKIFIQRIDGPIRLYNKMNDRRDSVTNIMNLVVADGTIFQSNYSKSANIEMGLKCNRYETTIMNAVDNTVFNKNGKECFSQKRKIRIIASSWSANPNKGFEAYEYLDDNLDFSKYEMIFVGNSPINFKNIVHVEPLESAELSNLLKQQDIYITASKNDPCSNSLIEALSCGIPAIAKKSGGHPEIVGQAGECFEKTEEIIGFIEKITMNYDEYVSKIQLPNINMVGALYEKFIEDIILETKTKAYLPKKLTLLRKLRLFEEQIKWKISNKIEHFW